MCEPDKSGWETNNSDREINNTQRWGNLENCMTVFDGFEEKKRKKKEKLFLFITIFILYIFNDRFLSRKKKVNFFTT